MEYSEFLNNKAITDTPTGLIVDDLPGYLFDFQRDIVKWALARGRACIFSGCGTGKTPMQLAWADKVFNKTGKNVLIAAPLAVSTQTVREAKEKFNVECEYKRDGEPSKSGITVTNYEMLHSFCPDDYIGFVGDESSILKSYTGKIRNMIIENYGKIPYRLACTATPSPNDYMELGNHSEFMGAMTRSEMLSMFFVHDGGETQKWRIKGHASDDFWRWVSSWAVMLRSPSDIGYDNGGFVLPPLNMHEIIVEADHKKTTDTLFKVEAKTLQERQRARSESTHDRCNKIAEIVNSTNESWILWCDRNVESEYLSKIISNSKEIRGSHTPEYKEKTMLEFSDGIVSRLITKPSIAGFGMNWQHCGNVAFVGLSDSYEQYYQALRRSWRYPRKEPVNCYIVISSIEGAVLSNIKRKERQDELMVDEMTKNMKEYIQGNIKKLKRTSTKYNPKIEMKIPKWMEK